MEKEIVISKTWRLGMSFLTQLQVESNNSVRDMLFIYVIPIKERNKLFFFSIS